MEEEKEAKMSYKDVLLELLYNTSVKTQEESMNMRVCANFQEDSSQFMCWKGTKATTPSCPYFCKVNQSLQMMIRRRSLITHHMDVCPPMWPQEKHF